MYWIRILVVKSSQDLAKRKQILKAYRKFNITSWLKIIIKIGKITRLLSQNSFLIKRIKRRINKKTMLNHTEN